MKKVYFQGTHRSRGPDETLERVRPYFSRFGITRLADVTGLDTLGIPVVTAVRPLAATLPVSQGRGADLVSAQVSAAMESLETWHAEYAVPPATVRRTPAAELGLPYRIAEVETSAGALATDATRLDWLPATGLVTGAEWPVPRALVEMRWQPAAWPPLLTATSNGLASGNDPWEAVLHGLYEVVERDATALLAAVPVSERVHIDPHSVYDPNGRRLLDRIAAHGGWVELVRVPSRTGVSCIVCYLWSPDFGAAISSGAGAHSDPAVALSRALTEAAQSRLARITGVRDDLGPRTYGEDRRVLPRPVTAGPLTPWSGIAETAGRAAGLPDSFASFEDEVYWLAGRIHALTGREPLSVELATEEAFAVRKVICPGLGRRPLYDVPRAAEGVSA